MLIIVALFGVAGLLALQFSRKNKVNRAGDRAVVQVENAENTNNPEASAPIQKIPGELLRTSEYPEAGASITSVHPRLSDIRGWPLHGFESYSLIYSYASGEVRVLEQGIALVRDLEILRRGLFQDHHHRIRGRRGLGLG